MEKWTLCILSLVVSVVLSQPSTSCNFTYNGYNFDLNGMYMDQAQGDYHGADLYNPYIYVMNVCGSCNTGGTCLSAGSILCQYEPNDEFIAVVAAQLTAPVPTWDVQNPANASQGVVLRANNGGMCNGAPRNVTFMFNCAPDAPVNGGFTVYEDTFNQCNYHVDMSHPNACPLPTSGITPLTNNVNMGPYSLFSGVWAYYSIYVDSTVGELSLTLKQTSDDNGWLTMYVRRGAIPTPGSAEQSDLTPGTQYHTIEIRTTDRGFPLTPGMYYIGVQAQDEDVNAYTLLAQLFACPNNCSGNGVCNTATKVCSCNVGYVNDVADCSAYVQEATLGVTYNTTIRGTQKAYFRYQINDTYADQLYVYMTRSANTPSALPALMIQYNNWPTVQVNNDIDMDTTTPSQTWEVSVEPPVLQNGVWIVGVQGSLDQFFTFSLWAQICDCPKCCSGHGYCQHALPNDYCLCDAGYMGTSDCSAQTMQLSETTPLNVTVDAVNSATSSNTRFFEISVPYSIAVTHVDMIVWAARQGAANDGIRVFVSPSGFPTESNYWYSSALPRSEDAEIIVPHADLYEDKWYVSLYNYANTPVNVLVQLSYYGWCPCVTGNGYCTSGAPALCMCNSGWQGAACDEVMPGDSSDGVETGGVVAMVIIFTLVGVGMGIFVKHKKPDLCERDKTLRDHITNEDL